MRDAEVQMPNENLPVVGAAAQRRQFSADMDNKSVTPSYFEFTLFSDYGSLRSLFFSLCLLIYMTIISANVVIILTVCLDKKSLSEFRGKALQTCLPHMSDISRVLSPSGSWDGLQPLHGKAGAQKV
ncbi:hypothetical protein Q8A73_009526 [Channa argus]|nr:hypothetical protein Q8A73_009526 [Channa argus]